MVPNPPGSGYDITARVLARALDASGVARGVEVFNLPGASGVVGLRRLTYERGNSHLAMLMGLGLVGAELATGQPPVLAKTTPVCRLVQEPAIVVVRRDSPYGDLHALVEAWRADKTLRVGGGSAVGGPDHLAAMLIAEAVGLEPVRVAYTRHDGGGDLLAAILNREVDFAMSGLSEYTDQIESGQLRALAVTSERTVGRVAVPTVRSAGFDVVVNNWRGLVAPPGLPAADAEGIRSMFAAVDASAEWAGARDRFGWTGAFLTGGDFSRFIEDESRRVARVLSRLGVAGRA
ncbi:tripartite tricarboxylate transporter substrate binding protein [Actinoplanes sp. LDG1-06]|uniref:Tripartite tricarboxylate transporter substrate binding protein n=2 Tax=Paractinoplanes ovalisporus TaxID=2810368 RepID=A0ABS2AFN5_9ACTN|nr:tripartite tricarboxylate transporter substrate binding protein [Actinoplanes ovalisporus]